MFRSLPNCVSMSSKIRAKVSRKMEVSTRQYEFHVIGTYDAVNKQTYPFFCISIKGTASTRFDMQTTIMQVRTVEVSLETRQGYHCSYNHDYEEPKKLKENPSSFSPSILGRLAGSSLSSLSQHESSSKYRKTAKM